MFVRTNRAEAAIAVLLIGITTAVYAQVLSHEFISFDDPDHNTSNPYLRDGFTWAGVKWAFTSMSLHTWHPLTWLSHMLDCELYGSRAWGHHLTNLVLHVANSILLFGVLRRLTIRLWPSAFVAAVFALHPLHVETVAWVSERLDVLCTLFWILGLGAYGRYASRPSVGRYLLVVMLYALSLMSKQMVVTFPFVLLLLDVWPLGRVGKETSRRVSGIAGRKQDKRSVFPTRQLANSPTRPLADSPTRPPARLLADSPTRQLAFLLLEKVPLILMSLVGLALAFAVKMRFGAVQDQIPLVNRLENAVVSYVAYLAQAFWPTNLAVFYPHPGDRLPTWQVAGSSAFLLVMTALLFALRRRHPALLVGWLWYLGTLVPVIGLVQVGLQARADRYTYIPLIGAAIVVAWGVDALAERLPARREVVGTLGTGVVLAMAVVSWKQAGFWRDSRAVFQRAVDVTSENYWAHNNLGNAFARRQQYAGAVEHYREALRIKPGDAMIEANLVEALNHQGTQAAMAGRWETAVDYYSEAIEIDPGEPKAHFNLGHVLARQGKPDRALEHYRLAAEQAEARNQPGFAKQIRVRLRFYEQSGTQNETTRPEPSS